MSFNTRKEAVLAASRRPCEDIPRENREAKIVEIFGEDVFSFNVMKDYLPKSSYRILMQTVNERAPLDAVVADDVANAMKQWAISKGASHYTHWFLNIFTIIYNFFFIHWLSKRPTIIMIPNF